MRQMPDSSSKSIRAVSRSEEQRSSRESISRKLGSTMSTSSSGTTGVLKRWVLSNGGRSKQPDDIKAGQGIQHLLQTERNSSEVSSQLESSEQLYKSHPRFGQQGLAARASSKQAARETEGSQGGLHSNPLIETPVEGTFCKKHRSRSEDHHHHERLPESEHISRLRHH